MELADGGEHGVNAASLEPSNLSFGSPHLTDFHLRISDVRARFDCLPNLAALERRAVAMRCAIADGGAVRTIEFPPVAGHTRQWA